MRLGVTGTDTGVGKTLVTTALIAALRDTGARVAPMKPVETGAGNDAELLRHAAGDAYTLDQIRPYLFDDPVAPLVAARQTRRDIDVLVLDRAFNALRTTSDVIVVEGAGGLRVPITDTLDTAALFARWSLDVIIVAANRLGVINHTLLTIDSAISHGLTVRAVVLNTISSDPPTLAEQTNHTVIQDRVGKIPVLPFPYAPPPHALTAMAALGASLARII